MADPSLPRPGLLSDREESDSNFAVMQQIELIDGELNGGAEPPPPPYGDVYGAIGNDKTDSSTKITDDGRVDIHISHFDRRLTQFLTPVLQTQPEELEGSSPLYQSSKDHRLPPRMNIVMQIVGSRGDVQPFVALGKLLQKDYGHRIRLATHPVFRDFVLRHGLEFFSIGGDPTKLMAFMVKNPRLRPRFRSILSGDVTQRRHDVAEYIQGCWRSCIEAGDGCTEGSSQVEHDLPSSSRPFIADLIIANPPSFAHIHCAEKLGIPLHIMFTMPYSATQAFPHPLANIQSSSTDPQLTNYLSYSMIDILSWQVLGDIINRFRVKCLALDPVSVIWVPCMLQRLKIPHTYCWSPALIPKPKDWGPYTTVAGFYNLDMASTYSPDPRLQEFLESGSPPIYIGFGSIVLDDPDALTKLVLDAAEISGQRVLLSKGWGGMGADQLTIPNRVFMLHSEPHDWLFKRVSCVVHHGGAGTTAAGITAGRPTVVIPFFGDQPFWGAMVARAGAGPDPIPYKQLSATKLANAIAFCLKPESLECAKTLSVKVMAEQGTKTGAQAIHRFLDTDSLRCALDPNRIATWRIKHTKTRLSAFAAYTLIKGNVLDFEDLKLVRNKEHYTDEGPWDPVSGGFTAFASAFGGMIMGLAGIPSETFRALRSPINRVQDSRYTSSEAAQTESATAPTAMPSQSETGTGGDPESQKEATQAGISQSESDFCKALSTDMMRPTGIHVSKGAGRFARAVVQGPVNMSVNFTRGFHNIPRLWGDETVRPQERVNDFKSGIKAVGREFGYGWYDGITGLVTQPWRGLKKTGPAGFVKGIGKGIGGFIAKPGAAFFGVLGHAMQGVNKEVQKLFGNDTQGYVKASRVAQGYQEWLQSSEAEREEVVARWKLVSSHANGKNNMYDMPDLRTCKAEPESG